MSSHSSSSEDEIDNTDTVITEPVWQLLYFLFLWQSVYRISNAAINNLLAILSKFVQVFGSLLKEFPTKSIKIPSNTVAANKLLKISSNEDFIEYVVCPKCDSICDRICENRP